MDVCVEKVTDRIVLVMGLGMTDMGTKAIITRLLYLALVKKEKESLGCPD